MSNRVISCEIARHEFAGLSVLSQESEIWRHFEACDACMDAWLVFSLEQKPRVVIPESFAHTVALACRPKTQVQVHRNTLWAGSLALLAVAMLAVFVLLDRQSSSVSFRIVMSLLAIEGSALALWLGRTSSV